jgi:hypothetical protein
MSRFIIPEKCDGCANISGERCMAIKEPSYFWDKYGRCFAKINEKQLKEIIAALPLYSPDPLRWKMKLEELRKEGLIPSENPDSITN